MSAALPNNSQNSADDTLRLYMDRAVQVSSLSDRETEPMASSSVRKRAFRDPRAGSRLATVALVKDDEVLRWVYDPPPLSSRRRARRGIGVLGDEEVVHGFQFMEVPANQISQKLDDLDRSLTPFRGLRRWVDGKPQTFVAPTGEGRTLLLIHGTFSRGDMYFEEFAGTPEGRQFMTDAQQHYDVVVTFDHPTLSVSPWINALDLERATAGIKGPIDVVCHSRGGLVAAWWLRLARPAVERLVFVASPLEGTSLAAPARLKAALDLLGNLARGIGTVANTGATVLPMLAIAGGLMKILGGLLSLGAHTPLLDAGVALVPGLAAQSRVRDNQELLRLLIDNLTKDVDLYAIHSNYEPPPNTEPWWKFWARFRQVPGRLADMGTDAIFDGPNDLVVDVASMSQLGNITIPKASRLDLSKSGTVHHCAYFRQPETFEFLAKRLELR